MLTAMRLVEFDVAQPDMPANLSKALLNAAPVGERLSSE